MADQELLAILDQGVEAWNMWRKSNPRVAVDLMLAPLSSFVLSGADLSSAILSQACLSNTDLSGAILSKAILSYADLTGANLVGADLSGARLVKTILVKADLFGANLSGVNFSYSDLSAANLSRAVLAYSDLAKCSLNEANLAGADLSSVDLSGANLSKAILVDSSLSKADLSGADLSGALLVNASLSGADLLTVDISGADLTGADLSNVRLYKANFRNAVINKTKFTSRLALNNLAEDLTSEQLAGCVFLDEQESRRIKYGFSFEDLSLFLICLDAPIWTPLDVSVALANIQLAINRVQYLLSTEDDSPEILEQMLAGPCFPADFNQTVRLVELQMGSLDIALGYIKEAFSPRLFNTLVVTALLVCGVGYACEKYSVVRTGAAEAFKYMAEGHKAKEEAGRARAETDAIRAKLAKDAVSIPQSTCSGKFLPFSINEGISKIPLDVVAAHLKVPSAFTPQSRTVRESPEKYLPLAVQPLYSFISILKDQGHEVRCRIYNAKEWAEKFGVDLSEAETAGLVSDTSDRPETTKKNRK